MIDRPSICVIGLGYIGLPTAIMFASNGFHVNGCDINSSVIELIKNKVPPFQELEFGERLSRAVDSGNLSVGLEPVPSDVYIITVQTPFLKSQGTADLRFLRSALTSIKGLLKEGDLIIIESTIPPGTINGPVADMLKDLTDKMRLNIAHVPEHALVGKLFYELINNPRLVGGIDNESTKKAADLYRSIVKGHVIETTAMTAEMVKIMENTYRDVNIALANELAKYAEKIGVNIWEALAAANQHPRVHIHQPGPGVGGECIAVDPLFLLNRPDLDMPLVKTGRRVNDSMPRFVVDRILEIARSSGIDSPKVAVLGLSFKANVADPRNSPSIKICKDLVQMGIAHRAFDPLVKLDLVKFQARSLEECLSGADITVILVDHDEFKSMSPLALRPLMRTPIVYDTKNCIDHSAYVDAGFKTCLLGYRCA
jgi:UDP-N-acetyl-D-mannosaminuronic acid dehydrogenase